MPPNYALLDELYKKEYEGTGRNTLVCWPNVLGKYPDWITEELKWNCRNYTPALTEDVSRLKEWGFVYNREKPFVDVCVGIGTAVTIIGVPGELVSLHITKILKDIKDGNCGNFWKGDVGKIFGWWGAKNILPLIIFSIYPIAIPLHHNSKS